MEKHLESSFRELERKGLLKKENIGIDQVKALLESASRNIYASEKNITIDEEACYTLAYNGMLKIARAVLFINGYRPYGGQQHATTIRVAGETLGDKFRELIGVFDKMRRKRNQFTYDPMLPLSRTEAENALQTAKDFYRKVKITLDNEYPQLKLFD